MFKNILIPISSEYYKKDVFRTGAFLASKFDSSIDLVYIIEEKTLNQTDKFSNAYRTPQEIVKTKKEIVRKYIQSADKIIFDEAKHYFKNKQIRLKPQELAKLKIKAKERDNYTCQNPNCDSKYLPFNMYDYDLLKKEVHHIKKLSELGNDTLDNFVTLCYRCHYKIHHIGNLKVSLKNNKIIFKEGFDKI